MSVGWDRKSMIFLVDRWLIDRGSKSLMEYICRLMYSVGKGSTYPTYMSYESLLDPLSINHLSTNDPIDLGSHPMDINSTSTRGVYQRFMSTEPSDYGRLAPPVDINTSDVRHRASSSRAARLWRETQVEPLRRMLAGWTLARRDRRRALTGAALLTPYPWFRGERAKCLMPSHTISNLRS